ncbi:FAD-dependent oxidoreductase [Nocardia miyunensis]|uniref:FAD-dependent oxidoreductase n=1 Tax=Nocardia miyunensis TaxID=282684 RepID=UPI0008301B8D|nr:FAD-dependent oxidoreductase [Nocardia miyunensis]
MTPIWTIETPTPVRLHVTPGLRYEVLVVGGGLTGLVTALLLAEHGVECAVLESGRIGAGTTGASTAKISLLQGVRAQQIRRRHSERMLRAYLQANHEAHQWLRQFCESRDVAIQNADAFTYAQSDRELAAVRREYDVLRAAGLPVELVGTLDTPFPVAGAVRLGDQSQVNPMPLLTVLAAEVESHGIPIYESSPVRAVSSGSGNEQLVETAHGVVRASTVVLATGTPILDRGGFFARLVPQRSYLTAYRLSDPIPSGMYISAGQPTRSVRSIPDPDGEVLLVGGNGHVVGRQDRTAEAVAELITWTAQWFPGATPLTSWSAQDYHPTGELPFAGSLLPGRDEILLGTGYAKWGLTNGVAAAHLLVGQLTGRTPDWSQAFATWRLFDWKSLPAALRANAGVAQQFSSGWLGAARAAPDTATPREGTGRVERHLPCPAATSTVDGTTTTVSAVCPHLAGIVRWNPAERSWDCPLHGSRFAADGSLLEGPATRSLPQLTSSSTAAAPKSER